MKSAEKSADNVLKEYEHFLSMINSVSITFKNIMCVTYKQSNSLLLRMND